MKLDLVTFHEYRDKKVENPWGEALGSIRDLVLEKSSGRVAYVVLGCSGFFGLFEKRFAVPWDALKTTYNGHQVFLSLHRRTLEELPGFGRRNWPDGPDPDIVAALL